METSFEELKTLTDAVYSGNPPSDFHQRVVKLLARYGFKLRQDDGINPVVTISHPLSLPGSMVVGLRYQKKDNTKTEDHFLFEKGQRIKAFYKGKLEKILPEYKGSHKLDR